MDTPYSSQGHLSALRSKSSSRAVHWLLTPLLGLALLVSFTTGGVASAQSLHTAARLDAANPAVTTYKYDTSRTGQNSNETLLNVNNVNSTQFGKHISYPVDGKVYSQPLYIPGLTVNGATHNVVFATTEHDSVYAFDSDVIGGAPSALWHKSFLASGVTSVPSSSVNCNDITTEYGISGTPVIDPSTQTLYVVANTIDHGVNTFRLHALDLATGNEKFGGPVKIAPSGFNPPTENQRTGLLLLNGKVYMGFGSHCDNNPYHGWIMGFSASTLQLTVAYNDTPNGIRAGIWESGEGLAADNSGNIYYMSGNGTFDTVSGKIRDAGDSFVKLSTSSGLTAVDYFTPFNQSCLESTDGDLGSGGPLLIPGHHELMSAGKEGRIYVVDMNNMGHFTSISNPCSNLSNTSADKVLQETSPATIGGLFSTPAYWNGPDGEHVIFSSVGKAARIYKLTSSGLLPGSPSSQTPTTFGFTGGNPVVSSNGTTAESAIVWIIDPKAVLRAYDATDLSHELYNSGQAGGRDTLDSFIKFSVATVANGKVFVGTQQQLTIFGELTSPPDNAFNNKGISNDSNPTAANFDNNGFSYSSQALQAKGFTPGATVTLNNVSFTWPNVSPGTADNYLAGGQSVDVTPVNNATALAFLGSANNGPSQGTGTINFTDGTTQSFTLGLSDWTLNAGASSPSFGNQIAVTLPYRNSPTGQQTKNTYVFYSEVSLSSANTSKTMKSVTLPSTTNQGQLHVFSIGTKAGTAPPPPSFNNVGTSDDSNPTAGHFDTTGHSYSAQALQGVGVTPGGTVTFNGVSFTWPAPGSGQSNNFIASGQVLPVNPVSNATTLAFLGSATNGPSNGTATITYTDGSTSTFTLDFSDWTLHGGTVSPDPGNQTVLTLPYRNSPTGKQTEKTFVFYASVTLAGGKTVKSVTLPSSVNQGQLHVFTIGTK